MTIERQNLALASTFLLLTACGSSDSSTEECSTNNDPPLAVWGFLSVEILSKNSDEDAPPYEIADGELTFEWSNFLVSSVMGVTGAEEDRSTAFNWTEIFVKPAKASCIGNYGLSVETAELIEITSSSDYTTEYPAGTSLNAIFGYNGVTAQLTPAGEINHLIYNYDNLSYPPLSSVFLNEQTVTAPVQFVLKPLIPVLEDSVHVLTFKTSTISTTLRSIVDEPMCSMGSPKKGLFYQ